jgi:quinol monooxygenase YgiN
MYGSIMRARVKPERRQEFEQFMGESPPSGETGFVGLQAGWEDKDSDRFVGVIVFKDKESYQRNSERPETNQFAERMQEYLDGGVEWLDVNWAQYIGAGSGAGAAAGV